MVQTFRYPLQLTSTVLALALASSTPSTLYAQSTGAPHGASPTQSGTKEDQLAKQVAELRAEVARLQATLAKQAKPAPMPAGGRTDDMGEMGRMGMQPPAAMPPKDAKAGMPAGGMSMMDMHKGEMGMPPDSMKMPGKMQDGMAMPDMKKMPDAKQMPDTMKMPDTKPIAGPTGVVRSMSSMPGMAGVSHLYHVGSTGFFLDQPQLRLSADQRSALEKLREHALMQRASAERRATQAEEELWVLTGAAQPDSAKVRTKAREIEALRTNDRLGFIDAVRAASGHLTAQQKGMLLGTAVSPK